MVILEEERNVSEQVVFYHTSDCHLCDVAEEMILPLLIASGVVAEAIDVADDQDAFARFGMQIPVLYFPATDTSVLWPFDRQAVAQLLTELAMTSGR